MIDAENTPLCDVCLSEAVGSLAGDVGTVMRLGGNSGPHGF